MDVEDKIRKEVDRLPSLLGQMRTRDEIAKTTRYLDSIQDSTNEAKLRAFKEYVAKHNEDRVMIEIELFELFDQISDFFLPGQQLQTGVMLDDLLSSARMWANLASRNCTPVMEQNLAPEGGPFCLPVAEEFRQYLQEFKTTKAFELWTEDKTRELRSKLYQGLEAARKSPTTPKKKRSKKTGPKPKPKPPKNVTNMMTTLRKEVGYIKTPNQIIKANHYLDHILNSDEDNVKDSAWRELVNTSRAGYDFDRIWSELSFFRTVGKPMGEILHLGPKETLTVDELIILAERWVYLAANNALGTLEEPLTARNGGSIAERLQAYLDGYQKEAGFEKWSHETMNDARFKVIKVWEEFQRKRSLSENGQYFIHFTKRRQLISSDLSESHSSKRTRRSPTGTLTPEPELEPANPANTEAGENIPNNSAFDHNSEDIYDATPQPSRRPELNQFPRLNSVPAVETQEERSLGQRTNDVQISVPEGHRGLSAAPLPESRDIGHLDYGRLELINGGLQREIRAAEENHANASKVLGESLHLLEVASDEVTVTRLACDQIYDKMWIMLEQTVKSVRQIEGRQFVPLNDVYLHQSVMTRSGLVKRASEAASQKEDEARKNLACVITEFQQEQYVQ